jgi:uncharacterized membrane protein
MPGFVMVQDATKSRMSFLFVHGVAFMLIFCAAQYYIHQSKSRPKLSVSPDTWQWSRPLRVETIRMEIVMKKFAALFARKSVNLNTEFARRRLAKSMPGEMASMQSFRLTGVSL